MNPTIQRIFLSLLSGLLLGIAWTEILDFPYLLFVAFVPLFILENGLKSKLIVVFLWSYISFVLFSLITSWWIGYASFSGAIMAILFNAAFMSTVFVLFAFSKKQLGEKAGYLSFVFLWLGFEYLHYYWDLSHPWLSLGNAFSNHTYYIQWYEYTGVSGGTLLILLVNVLIYKLYVLFRHQEAILVKLVQISVLIGGSFFWSYLLSKEASEYPNEKKLNVVISQPNINAYQKFDGTYTTSEQIHQLFKVIENQKNKPIDLIVAPETSIPHAVNEQILNFSEDYQQLKKELNSFPNTQLLIGISGFAIFNSKNSPTAYDMKNGKYYESYNSALLTDNLGSENQIYHKAKLVLGVEKLPFTSSLPFLEKLAIDLGGSSGTLTPEKNPKIFNLKTGIKIAPLICYESVYGEYVSQFVSKGAELLAIITNDGWWKDTPGYKQHLAYAKLRAIETRKWIVRSANTGVSAIISPQGKIMQSSQWEESTSLYGTVYPNDIQSFYVKYGDFIGRLASFLSVLIVFWAILSKYKRA